MKGKSFRRRQRNALAAKTANLYKAQFGKASKWDALPEAPTARDASRPSRAERKMKAMLDLMSADRGHKPSNAASTPAHEPPIETSKRSCRNSNDAASAPGAVPSSGMGQEPGIDASTAISVSKTKMKRKARLRERKERGKVAPHKQVDGHKRVTEPSPPATKSQTTKMKDPFHAEAIMFGEVAKQPPEVNLKRRHWRLQESDSHSRHADVLKKHLKAGEARLKAVAKRQSSNDIADQRSHIIGANSGGSATRKSRGSATMSSLKALVQAGSGGLA